MVEVTLTFQMSGLFDTCLKKSGGGQELRKTLKILNRLRYTMPYHVIPYCTVKQLTISQPNTAPLLGKEGHTMGLSDLLCPMCAELWAESTMVTM